MEVNSKMKEKIRSLYRSYHLKILPEDNFIVANAPVVFRILLALNLHKMNLDMSGLLCEETEGWRPRKSVRPRLMVRQPGARGFTHR